MLQLKYHHHLYLSMQNLYQKIGTILQTEKVLTEKQHLYNSFLTMFIVYVNIYS